jgi:hypothetical protein
MLDLDARALARAEYCAADVDLSPSLVAAAPPASDVGGGAGNPELLFSRGAYARPLTPEPALSDGDDGRQEAARPTQQTPPEKQVATGRTPGQLAFRLDSQPSLRGQLSVRMRSGRARELRGLVALSLGARRTSRLRRGTHEYLNLLLRSDFAN